MSATKVGVKLCGNCNPYIDTISLLESLEVNERDIEFVRWDEDRFAILLILNSCPSGCATPPDFSGPTIVVTNDSVNYLSVPAAELRNEIMLALHTARKSVSLNKNLK